MDCRIIRKKNGALSGGRRKMDCFACQNTEFGDLCPNGEAIIGTNGNLGAGTEKINTPRTLLNGPVRENGIGCENDELDCGNSSVEEVGPLSNQVPAELDSAQWINDRKKPTPQVNVSASECRNTFIGKIGDTSEGCVKVGYNVGGVIQDSGNPNEEARNSIGEFGTRGENGFVSEFESAAQNVTQDLQGNAAPLVDLQAKGIAPVVQDLPSGNQSASLTGQHVASLSPVVVKQPCPVKDSSRNKIQTEGVTPVGLRRDSLMQKKLRNLAPASLVTEDSGIDSNASDYRNELTVFQAFQKQLIVEFRQADPVYSVQKTSQDALTAGDLRSDLNSGVNEIMNRSSPEPESCMEEAHSASELHVPHNRPQINAEEKLISDPNSCDSELCLADNRQDISNGFKSFVSADCNRESADSVFTIPDVISETHITQDVETADCTDIHLDSTATQEQRTLDLSPDKGIESTCNETENSFTKNISEEGRTENSSTGGNGHNFLPKNIQEELSAISDPDVESERPSVNFVENVKAKREVTDSSKDTLVDSVLKIKDREGVPEESNAVLDVVRTEERVDFIVEDEPAVTGDQQTVGLVPNIDSGDSIRPVHDIGNSVSSVTGFPIASNVKPEDAPVCSVQVKPKIEAEELTRVSAKDTLKDSVKSIQPLLERPTEKTLTSTNCVSVECKLAETSENHLESCTNEIGHDSLPTEEDIVSSVQNSVNSALPCSSTEDKQNSVNASLRDSKTVRFALEIAEPQDTPEISVDDSRLDSVGHSGSEEGKLESVLHTEDDQTVLDNSVAKEGSSDSSEVHRSSETTRDTEDSWSGSVQPEDTRTVLLENKQTEDILTVERTDSFQKDPTLDFEVEAKIDSTNFTRKNPEDFNCVSTSNELSSKLKPCECAETGESHSDLKLSETVNSEQNDCFTLSKTDDTDMAHQLPLIMDIAFRHSEAFSLSVDNQMISGPPKWKGFPWDISHVHDVAEQLHAVVGDNQPLSIETSVSKDISPVAKDVAKEFHAVAGDNSMVTSVSKGVSPVAKETGAIPKGSHAVASDKSVSISVTKDISPVPKETGAIPKRSHAPVSTEKSVATNVTKGILTLPKKFRAVAGDNRAVAGDNQTVSKETDSKEIGKGAIRKKKVKKDQRHVSFDDHISYLCDDLIPSIVQKFEVLEKRAGESEKMADTPKDTSSMDWESLLEWPSDKPAEEGSNGRTLFTNFDTSDPQTKAAHQTFVTESNQNISAMLKPDKSAAERPKSLEPIVKSENGHSSPKKVPSLKELSEMQRLLLSEGGSPDSCEKEEQELFVSESDFSSDQASYRSFEGVDDDWRLPLLAASTVEYGVEFEEIITDAIQSLDSLNDQIVQFIFTPKSVEFDIDNEFSPKDREALKSSMAIMRRLLVDAQVKFRKMVDDNRQLASRIDGSILSANHEMQELRQELEDTNKRLSQLGQTNGKNGTIKKDYQNGGGKGRRLSEAEQDIVRLQDENTRLESQINTLLMEIKDLKSTKALLNDQPSLGDLKLELIQYQQELVRAKEALQAMKSDRKRLKAEKVDLLSQMKQLYQTLEEKEAELREFIRNYELRMRESDDSIKQLAIEKDGAEREKWEILKRARDAAERVVILKTELDEKNVEIQRLEDELEEARTQIRELKDMAHKQKTASTSDTGISSGTDVQTPSEEQLPTYYETPPQSARSVKSDMCTVITNLSTRITSSTSSENLRLLGEGRSRSAEDITNTSGGTLSSSGEERHKKKKKITGFGSLSRMFGRSKRRSALYGENTSLEEETGRSSPRVSTLNEDNYNDKLQTANQVKDIPIFQWKAHHVLAWVEITMNMPIYGRLCAENIKSGKILAEMSDSELESALGITCYLHRKKLRLAIEELKDPTQIRYPELSQIDHIWVAQVLMRDLGLPQYSSVFEAHHVDGRVLSCLTKKEMERHMQITRKFHQASILHGVELLRRLNFDREALSQRRSQCDTFQCDPLVWTNDRLIQWIHSIDLQEYAPNLLESGVHGAMIILESSFSADTMAAALSIPPSKSYIRRHLTSEVESLLKPARNMGGSLGKSFERSYRGPGDKEEGSKKKLSFRGSLGRAFGRKVKREGLPTALESHEEGLTPEKRSQSHEAMGTAV